MFFIKYHRRICMQYNKKTVLYLYKWTKFNCTISKFFRNNLKNKTYRITLKKRYLLFNFDIHIENKIWKNNFFLQ